MRGRKKEEDGGAWIFDVARADAFLLAIFRVWPNSVPFGYRAE